MVRSLPPGRHRAGITLTEILIAILILGVGLASLATLFPLGLLRLREATRSTRSAYLSESAAADISARGMLTSNSFTIADQYNYNNSALGLNAWFTTVDLQIYTPLTQDTPAPNQDWYTLDANNNKIFLGVSSAASAGYGLPFAYDPLWRFQTLNTASLLGTQGYYPNDTGALEARFGAGIGFVQNDPFDGGVPSAHGLQRLTNFNRPSAIVGANIVPIMPVSSTVPNIFVSPEDVVWVENIASSSFSPILPDMSISSDANGPIVTNDWHYSWMFTGQQNNGSSGSSFEGNLVIFENRPFGINNTTATAPNQSLGNYLSYQVDGETVVEGIFGYGAYLASAAGAGASPGFGTSADRAVLLRWYASLPDPVVKVGDWIADVTYERNVSLSALGVSTSRFGYFQQYDPVTGTALTGAGQYGGLQNVYNNFEWDNLPAQRCYWYRVQKAGTPTADSVNGFRSMVVYVDRTLQARTPLKTGGQPYSVNAALICPSVVNVIPQTFFTR